MGTAVSHFSPTKTSRGNAFDYGRNGADVALELLPALHADVPLSHVDGEAFPRERSETMSRMVNVVVASVAFVLALPVMALVALAVRLTSKGPVLYSQIRVGVDRRFLSNSADDRRGY